MNHEYNASENQHYMPPLVDTMRNAGYVKAKSIGNGQVILTAESGKLELWFCNKNHASYGIKYRNTKLEFARSLGYRF
jgi:hypothetical protein